MKKFVQLTYIVIGLEVYDDGATFLGVVRFKKELVSFVNKDEQKKRKLVYIFIYKVFTNSIFKSCTAIAMGFQALANWSYYKVKLLQNSVIPVLVILPSDIVLTSQTRSVLIPRAILPSTDSKNSCYCIITKRTSNWRKHCWITCKEKLQK